MSKKMFNIYSYLFPHDSKILNVIPVTGHLESKAHFRVFLGSSRPVGMRTMWTQETESKLLSNPKKSDPN